MKPDPVVISPFANPAEEVKPPRSRRWIAYGLAGLVVMVGLYGLVDYAMHWQRQQMMIELEGDWVDEDGNEHSFIRQGREWTYTEPGEVSVGSNFKIKLGGEMELIDIDNPQGQYRKYYYEFQIEGDVLYMLLDEFYIAHDAQSIPEQSCQTFVREEALGRADHADIIAQTTEPSFCR